MSRKAKYSLIEKLKAIQEYISDKKGATQIIHEMSIDQSIFYEWVRKYRHNGLESLKASSTNRYYSDSVKLTVVKDYLDRKGSLRDICGIYKISSTYVLRNWIKKYNSHKTFKSHNKQGDRIMTNGRKTTYEERIKIVAFCISNNDDYQARADKFKVSYHQVYAWVRKYEANGYESLMDRRGKRKEAVELTESEKLSAQLKLIEAENRRLKMENDFLKKLKEVESRGISTRILHEYKYISIKELHKENGYPIADLCTLANIARSSYYKWINRIEAELDKENSIILKEVVKLYKDVHGIYGYRRITMNINRLLNKQYNHKRIYRLMKSINMKSVIRKKRKSYLQSTPQITAENKLNREFYAEAFSNGKCGKMM